MTNVTVNGYQRSKAGTKIIDLNTVAIALDKLSKIRNRSDGYSMEIVKSVRAAIMNDTDHQLKALVLNIINHGNIVHSAENNQTKKKRSTKQEIETRIKEYQKNIDTADKNIPFAAVKGRKPKFCDSEYKQMWCDRQELGVDITFSNASLLG